MVRWLPGFCTMRLAKGLRRHHFDLATLETEAVAQGVIIGPFIIPSIFWQLEQIYDCLVRLSKERHACVPSSREKTSPHWVVREVGSEATPHKTKQPSLRGGDRLEGKAPLLITGGTRGLKLRAGRALSGLMETLHWVVGLGCARW